MSAFRFLTAVGVLCGHLSPPLSLSLPLLLSLLCVGKEKGGKGKCTPVCLLSIPSRFVVEAKGVGPLSDCAYTKRQAAAAAVATAAATAAATVGSSSNNSSKTTTTIGLLPSSSTVQGHALRQPCNRYTQSKKKKHEHPHRTLPWLATTTTEHRPSAAMRMHALGVAQHARRGKIYNAHLRTYTRAFFYHLLAIWRRF